MYGRRIEHARTQQQHNKPIHMHAECFDDSNQRIE